VKVIDPVVGTGIDLPDPGGVSSSVTLYPSGSVGEPDVVTFTLIAPVVPLQLMAKLTSAVAPAATVTARGLVPWTVQFAATPDRLTECRPTPIWERMVAVLIAIGCVGPPSSAKE
jgi:hypothetical protein